MLSSSTTHQRNLLCRHDDQTTRELGPKVGSDSPGCVDLWRMYILCIQPRNDNVSMLPFAGVSQTSCPCWESREWILKPSIVSGRCWGGHIWKFRRPSPSWPATFLPLRKEIDIWRIKSDKVSMRSRQVQTDLLRNNTVMEDISDVP